jgi:hypothetical protein
MIVMTNQFYDLFFMLPPMAFYPDDAGDSHAMAVSSRVDRLACPLDEINHELAELRDDDEFDSDQVD